MKKNLISLLFSTILLLNVMPIANSNESCLEFDLNNTFYFGYSSDSTAKKWTRTGEIRIVTWKVLNDGELNGKQIRREFGSPYLEWLRDAFQSWDDALDTVNFQEVSGDILADITIGWTQVLQLDYESLFTVTTSGEFRSKGTIEFKHLSNFLLKQQNFVHAAQSDIGHILGMGYITPSENFNSVLEWPYQAPYGQLPLGEYDVALIRAIYGESTCKSNFAPKIQNKIKEDEIIQAMAKSKAAEEARKRAQLEAETRLRQELYWISVGKALAEAELKAKQELDAKTKSQVPKRITITCVKGKTVKRVSAVNPKCPNGYKRK